MLFRPVRPVLVLAVAFLGVLFSGCASNRQAIALPYEMPALGSATTQAAGRSRAAIVAVQDTRADQTLDAFLKEPMTDFVRKALAAELVSGGAFTHVAIDGLDPAATCDLEVDVHEVSWMVPNHSGMVKTAFWTSFLTGGIGGIAYGSTSTPVYGHAVVALKITDHATSKVLLDDTFDAVHEEKVAKLKCDTLETRARVMAAALKAALTKLTQAVVKVPAPASSA